MRNSTDKKENIRGKLLSILYLLTFLIGSGPVHATCSKDNCDTVCCNDACCPAGSLVCCSNGECARACMAIKKK